jgi:hypothetical protein
MIDILAVFSRVKSERLKTFFIGESVSILPEYYKDMKSNPFDTPIHGWSIRSISGSTATIVRGGLQTKQKLFIECQYLKSDR